MEVRAGNATVQSITVQVTLDIEGMVLCTASDPTCSAEASDFSGCTPYPSVEEMLELGDATTAAEPALEHLVRVASDRSREYCYADGTDQQRAHAEVRK